MPGNCFYHHICQWCTQQGRNYHNKMCSQCKLVSYCSVDHQKCDWIVHKKLCKAIEFIQRKVCTSLYSFDGTTQEEWNYHRTRVMCSLELFLNRKLEIFERQMILFPNVCNVCLKYNNSYNPCVDCLCVYYCCKEHLESDRKEHSKSCKELKLCLELDLFLKNGPFRLSNIVPSNKENVFPNGMEQYIHTNCGSLSSNEQILFSEELSFTLTLIYSLLKSNKKLNSPNSITVHVIGASERESEMDKFMAVFFRWLPHIKQINMLLIGPECVVNKAFRSRTYKFEENTLLLNIVNDKLYHEYIFTKPDFVSPCVTIAYNCGFSEFVEGEQDSWSATIQCILGFKNVLFIVTSYNKLEADNDFSKIVSNNVDNSSLDIIIRAERNPFRSLRPIRDWESRSHVFYVNNFISIVNIF